MNGLRDDSVVLDVLENAHTWIYKLDKSLEDRQAWVARLKKRLVMADTISYISGAATATSSNICKRSIYKIPTSIREVDPIAYEPQVVSLGPYHHGKPQLRATDELKWCYLQRFISRNPEKDLDDYLALVEELESQARGAYSELESPVDSKDFIQMMLLDCCFLLELLLFNHENEMKMKMEVMKMGMKMKEKEEMKMEVMKMGMKMEEEEMKMEEKEVEEEEEEEMKMEEEEEMMKMGMKMEEKEVEEEEEMKMEEIQKEEEEKEEQMKMEEKQEKEEEEEEDEEEEEKEDDEEKEEDASIDPIRNTAWIDPIRNTAWALPSVMRDILLLENQLPFFLLEGLLELNIPHQTPTLTQIIIRVFWKIMPGKIQKTLTKKNGSVDVPIHHILHLMFSRMNPTRAPIPTPVSEDNQKSPSCIIPTPVPEGKKKSPSRIIPTPVPEDNEKSPAQKCNPCSNPVALVDPDEPTINWIPCAKQLTEAGVVFKKKENYTTFLDVTFKRGVMEIPPLQIFGYIDSVFRNLIAFEQCHTSNHARRYISAYAYLMNLVIDTPTDVQLLKQEGIIVSTLGSDKDVAILFNQLRKNTALADTSYLSSVFDGIKSHCDKRTNRWKATLNHNYFSNPWAIISVAAAIFLFVLTIMQTILAFFSYLRPISA